MRISRLTANTAILFSCKKMSLPRSVWVVHLFLHFSFWILIMHDKQACGVKEGRRRGRMSKRCKRWNETDFWRSLFSTGKIFVRKEEEDNSYRWMIIVSLLVQVHLCLPLRFSCCSFSIFFLWREKKDIKMSTLTKVHCVFLKNHCYSWNKDGWM